MAGETLYGGRPRGAIEECSESTLDTEGDADNSEAVVQEIFNGFLTQHFGEETLLLLDSSLTPTPQQKITTLKRLWDSKDYYAQRRMWRKRDGGYHKDGGSYHRDGGVTAAAKDHPNQSYKEGEPPNSRGGNSGRSSGQVRGGQRGGWSGARQDYHKVDKSTVTCFNCQKVGHYRSECPEARVKLGRISSPDPDVPEGKAKGKINGLECPVRLDTGVTRTGGW